MPEVRSPVRDVPLGGDLEAVSLVERQGPRLLGGQPTLYPVLVGARERWLQQQASQTEALPRRVHADKGKIPVRNGRDGLADATHVLGHRVVARSRPVAERVDDRGQARLR